MKVSIIVPTYNEENDIELTLNYLLNIDYDNYEIIFVDDSFDLTPKIISKYSAINNKIKLIIPEIKDGRCGARNIGILNASGEILVILNADVLLHKNFIKDILKHYNNGCDYLLVRSKVKNQDDLFARYVECVGILDHYVTDPSWMEWSEGFSCRKSKIMADSLFPCGYDTPIMAGEDGVFGMNLRKNNLIKHIDFSIVVEHIAPSKFKEYWSKRKERGYGGVQIKKYINNFSFNEIILRLIYRLMRTFLKIITLYPIYLSFKASKYSKRTLAEIIRFTYAWFIEQIAFHTGEIQAIRKLYL